MAGWQGSLSRQKERFLAESQEKVASCLKLATELLAQPWNSSALRGVARSCHQLAGSSGFFEMTAFAAQASKCESLALKLIEKAAAAEPADIVELNDQVAVLMELLKTEPDELDISPVPAAEPRRSLVLVCSDPRLSLEISGHLSAHPLVVHTYRTTATAVEHLQAESADALMIVSPVKDGPAWKVIEAFRRKREHGCVFLLSGNEEFSDKVLSFRLGVDACFEMPFDFAAINVRLKEVLDKEGMYLYRVLSVEDDPVQAGVISDTLTAAGYLVLSLLDPKGFEESLISFNPDLLLLDVDLGEISGFDLAKYVRSVDRFSGLPVVFLTTRGQLDCLVEGARAGGDEYLVKPVSTQYLIAAITSRIERYRSLQKLIERDGLTQSYTYSNFLIRVERLLQSGKGKRFAMVVFDVDRLGEVNRRLGLAAGDRAIAAVAKIVRAVFRQTELIGRTAGGEIAVMSEDLNDRELAELCSYAIGQMTLSEVFPPGANMKLQASAGIAEMSPAMPDALLMLTGARRAMRAAKKLDRGCVVKFPLSEIPDDPAVADEPWQPSI